MTTNINKFAYGCLPRIVGIRRKLVPGHKYTITRRVLTTSGSEAERQRLTLVALHRNFARFRVDVPFGSYFECYTYHELMEELDRQSMKEEVL